MFLDAYASSLFFACIGQPSLLLRTSNGFAGLVARTSVGVEYADHEPEVATVAQTR